MRIKDDVNETAEVAFHVNKNKKKRKKRVSVYRWEPAPPELTLSASLVAAEASDRLEPDWALLRLSAVENKKRMIFIYLCCK